jgi:predicted small metal-binding protein
MRVIDCECGETLSAANDDDLFKAARKHADEVHADQNLSDDDIRSMIEQRAYSASDS